MAVHLHVEGVCQGGLVLGCRQVRGAVETMDAMTMKEEIGGGFFFNTECWIMMLGFPPNYQDEQYFQDAIGSFDKLLFWQEEDRWLTRIIIRARVLDLQSIPHFILFSDAPGFEGDSWTVQCEILQHNLLGGGPPDEEQVPDLPFDGAPFDFFGLGQPGAGPFQNNQQQQNQNQGMQQQNDAEGE